MKLPVIRFTFEAVDFAVPNTMKKSDTKMLNPEYLKFVTSPKNIVQKH